MVVALFDQLSLDLGEFILGLLDEYFQSCDPAPSPTYPSNCFNPISVASSCFIGARIVSSESES